MKEEIPFRPGDYRRTGKEIRFAFIADKPQEEGVYRKSSFFLKKEIVINRPTVVDSDSLGPN